MPRAETHYLNADFDLGLRARPARLERPRLVRQVDELSVQALLGTVPGDAAMVRRSVPDAFLDHLTRCGLTRPDLLMERRPAPGSIFRPFGWSDEAMELNRAHDTPTPHPNRAVIRRANSRSFGLELESSLSGDDVVGQLVDGREPLESILGQVASGTEWVIKGEHGNAGLANRRVRAGHLTASDRRFVDGLLAEDDRIVVEPWRDREVDWCMVFDVPFERDGWRVHETRCTADGALVGALFEPRPSFSREQSDYRDRLVRIAEAVASRLATIGYFGPACVDAFSWRDGATMRLRPLVDLNARRSMSEPAYRFWQTTAPERSVYYRFFNRRKLSLPARTEDAVAALGELAYDRDRRRGALLASPPEFSKLAMIFVAVDRAASLSLEREFRSRFET